MNNTALLKKQKIRLHLTNIAGVGAVKLLESILPNFINQDSFELEEVYLPVNNNFLNIQQFSQATKLNYYKRFLPNSISRFLECTLFGGIFNGESPLLVLGDLPIRCKSKQTVFLQNTLLLPGENYEKGHKVFKYWVLRWIFKNNLKYVDKFIVQTKFMKSLLIENYPEFTDKVDVIPQPVPEWLIKSGIDCKKITFSDKRGLRLFYPAAFYPHKNHKILNKINHLKSLPVSEIILTIPDGSLDINSSSFIKCIGMLNEDSVIEMYSKTDALLFLSNTESYGFPLLEAMWLGLPIICCDLEYARSLCGTEAIYFKHNNLNSLHRAICELENRLKKGWRPKWDSQLLDVPKNWNTAAIRILNSASS
jgi:glycosyltransferase involved in cell wall biosynthesis